MTKRIYTQEQKEKKKAYAKDYYLQNAEKKKAYAKEYCLQNAEKKKAYDKEYNLQNAEKKKASNKDWSLKNPERVKEYCLQYAEKKKAYAKDYYLQNAEKKKAYDKEYRLQNPEKVKAYNKEYSLQNAEKQKAYAKEYRLQNPEKEKEYRIENAEKINHRTKKRRQSDLIYRLMSNLRGRIGQHCRYIKLEKNFRTIEALGCTAQEFKGYFEALFQPNMTWENYGVGGWVVDHIKPISLAKTIDEVYLLNHYTNLQPMWELDNILKSNKYVEPTLQLVA